MNVTTTTTNSSRPGFFRRLFSRKRPPSLTQGSGPLTHIDTDVALGFLPPGCSNATVSAEEFARVDGLTIEQAKIERAALGWPESGPLPIHALAEYAKSKRGDRFVSVDALHEAARHQAAEIVRLAAIWHREQLPPEEIVQSILNRVVDAAN